MANVTMRYEGKGSGSAIWVTTNAVGAGNVGYNYSDDCGTLPNPIPSKDVFNGGVIGGNVCWMIKTSDAASLLMYARDVFADDTSEVWFSLH